MKSKFIMALAAMFALSLAPAANAVVVVGGDNGWEVSFDGNINGFWVYEDAEAAPGICQRFHAGSSSGCTRARCFAGGCCNPAVARC